MAVIFSRLNHAETRETLIDFSSTLMCSVKLDYREHSPSEWHQNRELIVYKRKHLHAKLKLLLWVADALSADHDFFMAEAQAAKHRSKEVLHICIRRLKN